MNLRTHRTGKNMIYFKKIDSTSNFARGLACQAEKYNCNSSTKKILLDGAVIIAGQQQKGRGRFERQWISPFGGLWFTVIKQPEAVLKDLSVITLIAAASIVKVLKGEIKNNGITEDSKKNFSSFVIKWPNDIYFNNKKIAGILCETEKFNGIVYLFIGIGININFSAITPPFTGLNAISLLDITGVITNRSHLLAEVLNVLEKNYSFWQKTGDFNAIFKEIERLIIL
jgi:BirA family biotin operon repressor/biotin-[acetyl-CoA-carboxylase] ligase